jgi:hypothetical protein
MMVTEEDKLKKIEERIDRLEKDIKKVKEILELVPVTEPLKWEILTEEEKRIIEYLLKKKFEGATTTEIAEALNMDSPTTSGRVIVWRRLKRVQRVSKRMKGAPLVVCEGKRWFMNYEEYSFAH